MIFEGPCRWGAQIGLMDKRVPARPLAAGGRLTLNRLTRGAERRQSPEGDRYVAVKHPFRHFEGAAARKF